MSLILSGHASIVKSSLIEVYVSSPTSKEGGFMYENDSTGSALSGYSMPRYSSVIVRLTHRYDA